MVQVSLNLLLLKFANVFILIHHANSGFNNETSTTSIVSNLNTKQAVYKSSIELVQYLNNGTTAEELTTIPKEFAADIAARYA